MAVTNVRGRQLRDDDVTRADLNVTTTGSAVIRKVIAGTNITITSTGVDAGTGDVTISAATGTTLNGTGFVRMSGTTVSYITGTSAQFVKADGSLDSTVYQPLLTNPVTGTGTVNTVAKFISTGIGDSSITDSGSGITLNNITIITAPNGGSTGFYPTGSGGANYTVFYAKLGSGLAPTLAFYGDVGGSYRGYGIYGADSTYDGLLVYRETGSVVDVIFMGANQVSLPSTQKIAWANSGNSVGTLDVGISREGTNLLQINTGTANSYGSLKLNALTATSLAGTGSRMVVADANGLLSTQAIPGGTSGSGTTNYVAKWTSTSALGNSQIFDNGTNVGIGTASPAVKLDIVDGQLYIRRPSVANGASYTLLRTETGSDATLGAFYFQLNAFASATGTSRYVEIYAGDNSAYRSITFPYGNIGIGTTSPNSELQIGSASTNGNRILTITDAGYGLRLAGGGGPTNNYIQSLGTTIPLYFLSGNANNGNYVFSSTGRMGIGSTSPGGKVHIKQAASEIPLLIDSSASANAAYTQYLVGASGGWEVGMAGSGDSYKWFFSYGTFGAANARITITSGGNLGIGTTSPVYEVDTVVNTNGFDGYNVYGAQGGVNEVIGYRAAQANGIGLIMGVTGAGASSALGGANQSVIYGVGSQTLILGTNSTARITIFNNGRVFIGSSAADGGYQLDVNGTTRVTGKIDITSNVYYGLNIARAGTSVIAAQMYNSNGVLYFGVEGSTTGGLFTGSTAYAALIGSGAAYPLEFATDNVVRGGFSSTGVFKVNNLAGTGTRMVVVDASGNMSTQAIPGGGGGGTVTSVALAVNSTGTDVAISGSPVTSSGTITISIPSASASARGVLTSTDWTTFNNKIGGSGSANTLAKFTGTGTIGNSNISDSGTAITLSAATTISGLAGTGTRMVVADSTGLLSTQAIPSGGGGGGSVTSVALATNNSGTDISVSGSPITSSGTITLSIPDASASARGVITTGTQTIAGSKTFNSATTVSVTRNAFTDGGYGMYMLTTYTPTTADSNKNIYTSVDSLNINLVNGALSGNQTYNVTANLNQVSVGGNAGTISTQPMRGIIMGLLGIPGGTAMNIADFRYLEAKAPDHAGIANHVVTNIFGLRIGTLRGTANFVITNGWGVYQEGTQDNNYFAGSVVIGSTTVGNYKLDVTNTFRVNTAVGSPVAIESFANPGIGTVASVYSTASNSTIAFGSQANDTYLVGGFVFIGNQSAKFMIQADTLSGAYDGWGSLGASNKYLKEAFINTVTVKTQLIFNQVFNRQTASYTLVLADQSKVVEMNVATANNLTVPPNSSVAFPTGTQITIIQYGAGQTTIAPGAGVTLRSTNNWRKINAQYGSATLVKVGTDEWYIIGNLSA